jgi:hypothetical protein
MRVQIIGRKGAGWLMRYAIGGGQIPVATPALSLTPDLGYERIYLPVDGE